MKNKKNDMFQVCPGVRVLGEVLRRDRQEKVKSPSTFIVCRHGTHVASLTADDLIAQLYDYGIVEPLKQEVLAVKIRTAAPGDTITFQHDNMEAVVVRG